MTLDRLLVTGRRRAPTGRRLLLLGLATLLPMLALACGADDDAETASPVVGNTYSQLTACPGDPDWFALELPRRGGSVRVTLRALDGPGAGLPILDGFEPGGTPATVVEDRADGRFVGIGPVNRPGRVLLRVLGAPGALPAAYDLEVEVDHGPEPCVDDHLEGAEGNDSAVRAALIRPGRLDELVLCPESMEDWYAVDVGREGGLRLRVRGSGMRCELRTTDGARLIQACEPEGEGLRSVARIGLDRGRYRLRVLGDGPAEGRAYRLELEVL